MVLRDEATPKGTTEDASTQLSRVLDVVPDSHFEIVEEGEMALNFSYDANLLGNRRQWHGQGLEP